VKSQFFRRIIFARCSRAFRNVPSSSNPLTINKERKLIDLVWNKLNDSFIGIIDEQSTLILIVRHGCRSGESEPTTICEKFEGCKVSFVASYKSYGK